MNLFTRKQKALLELRDVNLEINRVSSILDEKNRESSELSGNLTDLKRDYVANRKTYDFKINNLSKDELTLKKSITVLNAIISESEKTNENLEESKIDLDIDISALVVQKETLQDELDDIKTRSKQDLNKIEQNIVAKTKDSKDLSVENAEKTASLAELNKSKDELEVMMDEKSEVSLEREEACSHKEQSLIIYERRLRRKWKEVFPDITLKL